MLLSSFSNPMFILLICNLFQIQAKRAKDLFTISMSLIRSNFKQKGLNLIQICFNGSCFGQTWIFTKNKVLIVLQKNIKFDDLIIPRDTWISIPLVEIHHMKKYWEEDASSIP